MSLFNALTIATKGMEVQAVRLNLVASNMANAEVASSSFEEAYKAKHVQIEATQDVGMGSSVKITEIKDSDASVKMKYDPSNPKANEKGMVYTSNVDVAAEMADMIAASRAYQMNVEVANMSRALYQKALTIGQ